MSRLAYQDRGHVYALDGHKVPSPTSVLQVLDKGGLAPAAARETALWAAIHARALVEGEVAEQEWLDTCKGAYRAVWNQSRDDGTALHAVVVAMIRGEAMPVEVDGQPVSERVRLMATQAARFMDAWDAQPVLVEGLVWSERFLYGGRLDLVADLADGCRWLIDYKTGKGVYEEAVLQLNAYAFAEYYVRPEDSADVPMADLGIERAGVVHVRTDGWDLVPVDLDARRQFGTWLHLQEVWRWRRAGGHVGLVLPKPEGARQ